MTSSDAGEDKRDFHTDDEREAADAGRAGDESVTGASGGPIDEDDMEAADGLEVTPEQAKNYEDMIEKGAHQTGEGSPEV